MSLISINLKWCKACGICVDLCPNEVLSQEVQLFTASIMGKRVMRGIMLNEFPGIIG